MTFLKRSLRKNIDLDKDKRVRTGSRAAEAGLAWLPGEATLRLFVKQALVAQPPHLPRKAFLRPAKKAPRSP